jgi:predicted RNase H-like HicB family nuclease
MQIPVLVEPINGTGYLARSGDPLALSAEGATRDEALQNLRDKITARLASDGAEILSIEVPDHEHPLAKFAGMFKDDPLFEEWQKEIAEFRRRDNENPNPW